MLNLRNWLKLGCCFALSVASVAALHADTLTQITSSSAQAANDSLVWSQEGADGTVLAASFSASTFSTANSVTVGMGAANSVISVVCTASPCSWTGTGFTAGHSLLWSSDAGNGGSGPVTLTFSKSVAGAGALVQADLPGAFTGQIQVYNGTTLLATYTVASDTAGDPVYLGALDSTGANISKVVFSLTACASLCTDFGLDTVNLNAAAAPTVTLTPGPLTFAATPVGTTTAAQTVTIKNSGTATLNLTSETITGTNATSFIESANTCGATLTASASCAVSVEFKPAATGTLTAALSIVDNAVGSPQSVSLTGTGTAPAVSLTPASVYFATTVVGATSASLTVPLKNTGTAPLAISSIVLGGTNPTSFVEISTCGSSLAAGATCYLLAGFKPASAAALSATVSVTDNAAGSPHKVTLFGTGTAAPTMKLSTTSVTFPTTLHGTTSAATVITLTNSGAATATIGSIMLAGANPTDFVELSNCAATLAPAAYCYVFVAFNPAAAGAFNATVNITDNGAASPQSVALAGTGN
jgi:hypothetical protein